MTGFDTTGHCVRQTWTLGWWYKALDGFQAIEIFPDSSNTMTIFNDPLSTVVKNRKLENFDGLSGICPRCGTVAGFDPIGSFGATTKMHGKAGRSVFGGKCRSCAELVLGVSWYENEFKGIVVYAELVWPATTPPDRAPSDVEPSIRKAYDEAREIVGVSPQGAAVLARRCVQHAIREKLGIKCRTLFDEILKAAVHPDLTRPTREALDHVRKIGNWGAHPDYDQAAMLVEVTREEANYTLGVVELLFEDLYRLPAKTAAMLSSLNAKH